MSERTMMNDDEVISMYESVCELTGKMLVAAQSGNWDDLVELESRCASRVQVLRDGEAMTRLTGERRSRKVAIIHTILAHDRAIRDLTSPWMAKLGAMMQSTGVERKLANAYGAQGY